MICFMSRESASAQTMLHAHMCVSPQPLFIFNAAALGDMGLSKDPCVQEVVRLGVASAVLDHGDCRKTAKFADAFKVFSVMKARAFIKEADGAPILMFRTGDGTLLLTKERYRHLSAGGRRRVLRVGFCSEEDLMQEALWFVKASMIHWLEFCSLIRCR